LPAGSTLDLGEHRLRDLAAPVRLFQLGNADFPPLQTLANTNLPLAATPFVRRQRELREVDELLREGVQLLTLTGPGGTGKSRLALRAAAEVADHFPDGVWWLPLPSVREPALVAGELARLVGVVDEPGREPEESLAAALAGRRQLLVLDNAEHLLRQLAVPLAPLVAVEGPTFLATSREHLRIAPEQVHPVPPLDDDEAVELFTARARARDPAFESSAAVMELCWRLDNLPLALGWRRRALPCSRRSRSCGGWCGGSISSRGAWMRTRASRRCARRSPGHTIFSRRRSSSCSRASPSSTAAARGCRQ
jgi:hypothetical protein